MCTGAGETQSESLSDAMTKTVSDFLAYLDPSEPLFPIVGDWVEGTNPKKGKKLIKKHARLIVRAERASLKGKYKKARKLRRKAGDLDVLIDEYYGHVRPTLKKGEPITSKRVEWGFSPILSASTTNQLRDEIIQERLIEPEWLESAFFQR